MFSAASATLKPRWDRPCGNKPADVILVDIGLTKLNGSEACRRISEQSWGKGEAGFDHHPQALMKMLAGLAYGFSNSFGSSLSAGWNSTTSISVTTFPSCFAICLRATQTPSRSR